MLFANLLALAAAAVTVAAVDVTFDGSHCTNPGAKGASNALPPSFTLIRSSSTADGMGLELNVAYFDNQKVSVELQNTNCFVLDTKRIYPAEPTPSRTGCGLYVFVKAANTDTNTNTECINAEQTLIVKSTKDIHTTTNNVYFNMDKDGLVVAQTISRSSPKLVLSKSDVTTEAKGSKAKLEFKIESAVQVAGDVLRICPTDKVGGEKCHEGSTTTFEEELCTSGTSDGTTDSKTYYAFECDPDYKNNEKCSAPSTVGISWTCDKFAAKVSVNDVSVTLSPANNVPLGEELTIQLDSKLTQLPIKISAISYFATKTSKYTNYDWTTNIKSIDMNCLTYSQKSQYKMKINGVDGQNAVLKCSDGNELKFIEQDKAFYTLVIDWQIDAQSSGRRDGSVQTGRSVQTIQVAQPEKAQSSGISAGTLGGAVAGTAGVILAAVGIAFVVKRRKNNNKKEVAEGSNAEFLNA
ncbi:hypothetical protein HDU79_009443 [Rhizoclosmatium sp. JEL0117]|nr:hypothetical protein HDU79_009443 [Rhizoclosmatium sp. JEL0117]